MRIFTIMLGLLLCLNIAEAQSFNPKGNYAGPLSLVDVGSIGGYPCAGTIGEIAYYSFDVSFRKRTGIVSAPYYNETMKGSVLSDQRSFKIKKRFLYASIHPTTVTLKAKNITNTTAKMTFTYRLISNSNPLQGCLWTYKGNVTRTR